jgi:hypothetical protein
MQARQFYEKHGFVAKRLGINPINRQPNIEYVWNPREAAKNMESYYKSVKSLTGNTLQL